MPPEFQAFPKLARLNRDIVITEKIDGTNAAVIIERGGITDSQDGWTAGVINDDDDFYKVAAQSRKKIITPGKSTDNAGFAGWVHANAEGLVRVLGEGIHFGEWWGLGIQRNYGLKEKRFSLFNTLRWTLPIPSVEIVPGLSVVPVLYEGPFDEAAIKACLGALEIAGSMAAPGFADPEGIVIFHTAARTSFKVTIKNDESPKGLVENA